MKSVRIAGGLGFYGDSWRPIKASIERGNVQYVVSDHLAELTLAILQKDRQRDPQSWLHPRSRTHAGRASSYSHTQRCEIRSECWRLKPNGGTRSVVGRT